jgi:excisionase family DNA binding protein
MSFPVLYTPEEVADRLKVTRRSVYEWIKRGRLKGLRAGQYWRVSESDLLAFLEGETPESATMGAKFKKR